MVLPMLLWLRKKIPDHTIAWSKLILLSAALHGVVILCVVGIYISYRQLADLMVSTLQDNVQSYNPVLFVALSPVPLLQKEVVAHDEITVAPEQITTGVTMVVHKKRANNGVERVVQEKKQALPKKQKTTQAKKQLTQKKINMPQAKQEKKSTAVPNNQSSAALQQEIERVWKAPFGMHANCTCQLHIAVGPRGGIKDITVLTSSGVLLYDIAARASVLSMTMPQWTWGKSFTITFKQ